MKVLIGTDLEGVAGVVSFTQQTYADSRYYDRARRLLTFSPVMRSNARAPLRSNSMDT